MTLEDDVSADVDAEDKDPKTQLDLLRKDPDRMKAAEELLEDPKLLYRIKQMLDGRVYREDEAKLTLYLSAVSLKLEKGRLNVLIRDESSAGKTHIMSSVLDLVPEENKLPLTRISKTAFEYMDDMNLNGMVLSISEGAGLEAAIEFIKNVTDESGDIHQSLVTTPNEKGKGYSAKMRKVRGSPVLFSTSARVFFDPEMLNRTLIINLDTSEEQTKGIISRMLDDFREPWRQKAYEEDLQVFQDAFRLIEKGLMVAVELEEKLLYDLDLLNTSSVKARRDSKRLLYLICASCALHHRQRQKTEEGAYVADIRDLYYALRVGGRFFKQTAYDVEGAAAALAKVLSDNDLKIFSEDDATGSPSIIPLDELKKKLDGLRFKRSKSRLRELLAVLEDGGLVRVEQGEGRAKNKRYYGLTERLRSGYDFDPLALFDKLRGRPEWSRTYGLHEAFDPLTGDPLISSVSPKAPQDEATGCGKVVTEAVREHSVSTQTAATDMEEDYSEGLNRGGEP